MPIFVCQNSSCNNRCSVSIIGNYRRIDNLAVLTDAAVGRSVLLRVLTTGIRAVTPNVLAPTTDFAHGVIRGIAGIAFNGDFDPQCKKCGRHFSDFTQDDGFVSRTVTGLARDSLNVATGFVASVELASRRPDPGLFRCGKCDDIYCDRCCIHDD